MPSQPTISVITLGWRNEQFAAAFGRSLVRATERAEGRAPQLVVVANGPDGIIAADAVAAVCAGSGLRPQIVALEQNTGFSGGANEGVARADGEILVVTNLDLTFDERFLLALGEEALSGDWDLLAPRVVQGPTGQETGVARRTVSHRLAWVAPPPELAGAVAAGNGSCLVLRRRTLDQREAAVGGLFDPEYHSFNEDIDLFWWAGRQGLTVRYAPHVRVDHALAGSFGGDHRFRARPLDVQRRVMANYRVTVWKNASGFRDWAGWPLGEATYFGLAVQSRGAGGVGAYAASWSDAFRTVRAIRSRRERLRPPARSSR